MLAGDLADQGVDAGAQDVAEECRNAVQALQTKQQLGVQALSIANAAPQTILSLFKN